MANTKTNGNRSYCKQEKGDSVNWHKMLSVPFAKLEWDDLSRMRMLASNWVTCAVGNQCAIIPRDSVKGFPDDSKLLELGRKFYANIDEMYKMPVGSKDCKGDRYRLMAIAILEKIEKRSAQVIRMIKNKQPK